jgi:hypothetical protein
MHVIHPNMSQKDRKWPATKFIDLVPAFASAPHRATSRSQPNGRRPTTAVCSRLGDGTDQVSVTGPESDSARDVAFHSTVHGVVQRCAPHK